MPPVSRVAHLTAENLRGTRATLEDVLNGNRELRIGQSNVHFWLKVLDLADEGLKATANRQGR